MIANKYVRNCLNFQCSHAEPHAQPLLVAGKGTACVVRFHRERSHGNPVIGDGNGQLFFFAVYNLKISLNSSTPNDNPTTIHHWGDVSDTSLNRLCSDGKSITMRVDVVTNRMVSHNQRLVKKPSVKKRLPARIEKIIVN